MVFTFPGPQLGSLRGFLSDLSSSLVLVLALDCLPSPDLSWTISAVEAWGLFSVLGTKLNFLFLSSRSFSVSGASLLLEKL